MSLVLITSIMIRLAATGWSIILLRRLKDWRVGFLTVMLGLMALRQIFTLLAGKELWIISVTGYTTELPGLAVSVMAFLAVFFLERMITAWRRTEQVLQASEERYRSLTNDVLDSSAVGIFILDSDFRVVWMNQSLERYFALRRDDIIGKDKRLLLRKRIKNIFEDPESFAEKVLATYDNNTYIENFECHVLPGEDREERWLEHWSQPIKSGLYAGGRIEYYYDITERKRAKEALREKDLMVQSLIAHAPYSIWVCDGEGTIIFANQAAFDMFGVTDPAQIINRYNIYRNSTEAEKPFLAYFERAWNGEIVRYRQELDMTTVKYDTSRQETLHFYTTLFAIPTGKKKANIVVIQEDITEKVRAEEHIQHLQSVLKAIRNINKLIIHEKNQQKLLQRVCEILNQTRDYKFVWIGLIEEGTKDVLPAAQAGFEEGYLKSIKITWENSETGRGPTGTAIKTKKPFVMRDIPNDPRYEPWREEAMKRGYASSAAIPLIYGNKVYGTLNVYTTIFDVFDEEEIELLVEVGGDIAYALHNIDIEEEHKRAEEALRKAHEELEAKVAERTMELAQSNIKLKEIDRLKSEFIATMSHELRTPLNSIIGFTGIILKGIAGPINEEQKKQLSMVYDSAKHLLSLINDILDLSRIESGKMEKSMELIKIEEVISEVAHILSPIISLKGLTLTTEKSDEVVEIYCDRKKVFQILLNLVNNAVKFTDEGEIKIECKIDNNQLMVSVSDTGIGIEKENMDYLFEAFRQIDGTAKRRYQGAGLGLYLCKKLVTLLGGKIWAESEYGKGSKFTFTLPLRLEKGSQHEKKDIDRRG